MAYRIAFAGQADAARRQMTRARRAEFDQAMAGTIGTDPYGHGSNAIGGEKDRREATVAGAFVVYYVAGGALTITAVKVIDQSL
ncbi:MULTISPECIES: hypothetical protein [Streptomyces]|uniref:Type II toxin-antitoxin system RelE/ParE family toxin n=1 Tax=Streptomyces harbinensis TaxID=1176198 RepID=A0A1I6WBK0_9ACTN|nr:MULTISPECIES: hypothetical protein [Streptomyces]SFT23292.1 hypothetical protein SAMN05444716_11715 [Streptomyces harbinensis]